MRNFNNSYLVNSTILKEQFTELKETLDGLDFWQTFEKIPQRDNTGVDFLKSEIRTTKNEISSLKSSLDTNNGLLLKVLLRVEHIARTMDESD